MNRVSFETSATPPDVPKTIVEATPGSTAGTDSSKESDSEMILKVIRARLLRSVYIAIRAVETEFTGGVLYFRGTMPTFYTKQVLLSLAEDLGDLGVEKVVDETVVMKH